MAIEHFGKYELIERLGSGGMAEVFLARTASIAGFEKLLAIKRLLPFCTQDQETVDLLADEARITVKLSHPNIVQVFDFGRVEDTYYIAMEYVDGLDLKTLVRVDELTSTPLRLDLALHITTCILDALDFAHGRTDERGGRLGIIHRDVSPHNVLISRHGQIKLTDFGVARAAISIHVSRVGDIRGKFSYMPPEQVCGGEIDRRVDIFAAGAILYELLTGYQPYRSASANEQLQLLRHEVEPPSRYREDLSSELDAICLHALDKNPERRFGSAGEFAAALRAQLLRHYGASLPPTGTLAELVEERLRENASDGEAAGEESGLMGLADFSLSRESLIAPEAGEAQQQLRSTIVDDELDPRNRATVHGRREQARRAEFEEGPPREREDAIPPSDTEAFAPPLLAGNTDELMGSDPGLASLGRSETGELEETVISFRPARAKTSEAARLEEALEGRHREREHAEPEIVIRERALEYLKTEASDPSFDLPPDDRREDAERRGHRRPGPSDPTDRLGVVEDAPQRSHRPAPADPSRRLPDAEATIASLRLSDLRDEESQGNATGTRRSFLPLLLVLIFSFLLGIIVAIVVATF